MTTELCLLQYARQKAKHALPLLLLLLCVLMFSRVVLAQDARVNTEGLRLRAGPSTDYPIIAELALDTPLTILGRNDAGTWLMVRLEDGQVGWVYAEYVDTIAAAAILEALESDWLIFGQYLDSATVEHVREIYALGQESGQRAATFSKVGDSITAAPHVLNPIGDGVYNLGEFDELQNVIDTFSEVDVRNNDIDDNAFNANSYAAAVGWNTFTVLDANYADPDACEEGESPLRCEYRITRPAIALIMLGTNDVGLISPDAYEANLRRIIDITLEDGIIPILSTIPNQPKEAEGVAQVNAIIVDVARENAIPLWDYHLVMSALPDEGLNLDGVHPSIPPGGVEGSTDFREGNLIYGYVVRNLSALYMLDAVQQAIMSSNEAP